VVGRRSSDAAQVRSNRRIFSTSLGDPTVPASFTRQLLRNQEFAMVTVPKDERNPFNKMTPRFFEVATRTQPRSMSDEFRVETGALSPEFHALRIVAARGDPRDE